MSIFYVPKRFNIGCHILAQAYVCYRLGLGLIIMIVIKMEIVDVMISVAKLIVRLISISGVGVAPKMAPPPIQGGST